MSIAVRHDMVAKARSFLPWALLIASIAAFIVLTTFHDAIFHRGAAAVAASSEAASEGAAAASPNAPRLVNLPEQKFKAAGVISQPVKVEALPSEVAVPGKIEVDGDHSVQIQPRAPGVIREVKVVQGQRVKKGDLLARLDSAEVGTARLNLIAKQRALDTTRIEARWKDQVALNVKSLIPEIRKNTEAAIIEKQYVNRPLGSFRALLLQAYAEFDIASHEEIKTNELYDKQIVREHPKFLAVHNRESAQAKIEGIMEQALFDANQQKLIADQEVKLAEGAVIDAAQRLKILGVFENIDRLLAEPSLPSTTKESVDENLTTFEIVAPFDGTIITKSAVPSQKAEVNTVLFHLADLSKVWVSANIPESEFGLIPQFRTGRIRLSATAYPGRFFEAKLLSIGSTVDPTTRTVSVLAETANDEGLLKLGLFVRIVLDSETLESALTIPKAAVVDIEGITEVFVPQAKAEQGHHAFALRTVKLGRESGDRRIVLSGLTADDHVVSEGAFLLKSEYILQNETEEE